MKMKKITAFLICLVMLMSFIPSTFAATSKTTLAVGDVIQIGTYGEGELCEPVTYKVMGKRDADGDGVADLFLASTKIVTAKEINKYKDAMWKGSTANSTLTSDLRLWLNSEANSFASLRSVKPSYEGAPGFMSTMKSYEKAQIVEAKLKTPTYVAVKDANGNSDVIGTSTAFSAFNATWPHAWTNMAENYNELQYVEHSDKVFIPSIEEIYTFFGGDNISSNIDVELTAAAVAEAPVNVTDQKEIWARDAWTADSSSVVRNRRIQYVSNSEGTKFVQTHIYDVRSALGIRPCMYLKADTEIERANADGIVYQIKQKLTVGDKIQIGTYGEGELTEPVEYKVMGSRDANGDGVEELFLASTKIVSFKEINAYGQSVWKGNTGNTESQSDLRAWLNSDAATFASGKSIKPAYEGTPGFMSTMSDYEKSQIVTANLNSLVNVAVTNSSGTSDVVGTGTGFSTFNAAWPAAWTTMAEAYDGLKHTVSQDKVFIPSIEELYTFFGGDNIMANINVELTKAAATEGNSAYASAKRIWTRDNTTTATNPVAYRNVYVENSAVKTHFTDLRYAFGVRPCMYINADANFQLALGATDVYTLVAPTTAEDSNAYVDYAQTTKGTVVRANVYNDSETAKTYMLIMVAYDGTDFANAKMYELSLGVNKEGYVDSDVLDCGSTLNYKAFLWEKSGLEPLTEVFPVDVTVE